MASHDNIVIFDRVQLCRARARAVSTGHDGFLRARVEASIADRLRDIKRSFPDQLALGPATLDIDETIPCKEQSCDLIVSPLALHTVNDLPGALIQIRRALRPDGLFIGALFGGDTLRELRESLMEAEMNICGGISPRVAPMAGRQDLAALMQRAGFALPVVDADTFTVMYNDIFRLMTDLRGMGETNALRERRRGFTRRALFMEAGRYYHKKFAETDGKIPATFEVIYLTGWAPHESQQKPLARGSAQKSLADVL